MFSQASIYLKGSHKKLSGWPKLLDPPPRSVLRDFQAGKGLQHHPAPTSVSASVIHNKIHGSPHIYFRKALGTRTSKIMIPGVKYENVPKEPGPFKVPVKLWRVCLETILPDFRMGPKSYQIICGTKYQYWTIFGSHSVPVMASA